MSQLPYRNTGGLGADLSGGLLVDDDDGAGVVEGLDELAGGGVGAVLEGEAVREGSGGGEEEEGSSGSGSLGGQGTVETKQEEKATDTETGSTGRARACQPMSHPARAARANMSGT